MKTIILEDRIMLQLLKDPRVLVLIPSLHAIQSALVKINDPNCRACAATRKRDRVNAIRQAKQLVLGTNAAVREELKRMLNVAGIRVVARNAQGALMQRMI